MIIKEFSKKQSEILKFINEPIDTIICDGAVRSGKTLTMTLAFVIWVMDNFNKTNFAICGKTVSNAERNILKPFQQVEQLPYSLTYRVSSRCLTVKCGKKENYIYFFGGKDESSYMLIQGITLAGVLFDEVALMPRSFVEQAIARTLSFKDAKIWFNCNPESPTHWFYIEWILSKEKHTKHLHFTMKDNPIMGIDEINRAEKMFSGVFYDRYIRGLWVVAEGAIYKVFSDNEDKYYTDNPNYDFIQIGVDFGGNGSAHSFTATGLKWDYSTLTVLMSEKHIATNTTPEFLYEKFLAFYKMVKAKYGDIAAVYADSAEQVLINGMKTRFTEISIRNSIKNEILERIRITTSLMSQGRFFITKDCRTLVKALKEAVYNSKKLNDERLDDGTSDIDSLDSFEYSFERYLRQYSRS